MKTIGITGGIGSGKTRVCKILEKMGIPVFYADDEAKKLYDDESVKKQVIALFGEASYSPNGVDRVYLSRIVFNDPKSLKSLENILHPALERKFKTWLEEKKDCPLVAKEAAILIESGGHNEMDFNVLVCAPKEVRIQRVILRDAREKKEIEEIIARQLSDEEKQKHVDFVIENDGERLLTPQIDFMINNYLN